MEKRTPHYPLTAMQDEIAKKGTRALTITAMTGGLAMGLEPAEMLEVLAGLSRRNFYKSMTTYNDHTLWQDVYHALCPNGKTAYIKLTAVTDRIVIQFKEK